MHALEKLIRPISVAIIGASADPNKLTGRPIGYLRKHGFAGAIYPVNPRVPEIAAIPCYPDVASLPETPDVAIVLLAQERTQAAIEALAARGTGAAIVLAGGYGEAGEAGKQRQGALLAAAGDMRLLGPNTIGLVNLTDHITLSASGALELEDLHAGRVGVVSQSGGIMGALLSRAGSRGIGLSKLIATGNEVDIDAADAMDFLVDDEATSVIAVYLEGLRNPTKFQAVARRAAEANKPIVVFKVGRSESGARSAVSHTGALSGADRMYDALFRQLGIVRANTFADLLDLPAALAAGRRPAGKRVAVLTSTGGAGTLVADACGVSRLDVPLPDAATAARIAALLPDGVAAGAQNPIDVTLAGLQPDLFRDAISALLESPTFDAVVVVVGSSALTNPTLVAHAALEGMRHSAKPLLVFVSPHAPHVVQMLNWAGVPAFTDPESCAAALTAMQARPVWATPAAARATVDPGPLPSGPLDEHESKQLFARFGIRSVREVVAKSPAEAAAVARGLGDRLVVKLLSREVAHKSEIGGVKVGVGLSQVAAICEAMEANMRQQSIVPDGFLIQEMVRDGVEMILGFSRDPQLGPSVLLGFGGVTTELFEDVAIRLLPIDRAEAESMIGELKARKLLQGFRGAPPCDVAALVDAVLAFATLASTLDERLDEAEINPLFVLPQGIKAADGLVVLR